MMRQEDWIESSGAKAEGSGVKALRLVVPLPKGSPLEIAVWVTPGRALISAFMRS